MKKTLLVVTLNVLAIGGPAFGLAKMFGAQETVQPDSAEHLLALIGVAIFAFALGTVGARISVHSDVSMFDAVTISFGSEGNQSSRSA